jgi:RND family efflux transporter MFP subunit
MIGFSMYGRKKFLIAGAVISLALIAGGVIVKARAPKPPVAAAQNVAALTVTSASPRRVTWPTTLEVPGAIAPWQEAIVSAQISGYQITEVLVNVGDQVRKGQVLARINQALLRADEALALANFEQAEANHKRAVALKTNGFISDQNILQLETQVKTTKALLDAKRLQLHYTEVTAPDDGAISARNATIGSVANTGQELFRLVRQNRLEWRGELSARQIAQIQPGQPVHLSLPSGASANAVVRQASPTLSTDSRLGLVYADIEANSGARAGMYAVGRISIGEAPALAVPAEAVVLRDGRTYVLELATAPESNNTAKVLLRAVEVGRREGQEVEVVSGLGDGARLAVRGSGFLNDGDSVRVVEPVTSKGALH